MAFWESKQEKLLHEQSKQFEDVPLYRSGHWGESGDSTRARLKDPPKKGPFDKYVVPILETPGKIKVQIEEKIHPTEHEVGRHRNGNGTIEVMHRKGGVVKKIHYADDSVYGNLLEQGERESEIPDGLLYLRTDEVEPYPSDIQDKLISSFAKKF